MSGYAWVTLATNDSYSLGALVLAHSLRKANTAHKLAVLITPAVSQSMREQLQTVFDVVKTVDVLDSKDEAHLALMKRPELGITFTKIHCWRLTEFEKCVFLDADTLVVRNSDELFEREEFSAAPDVSWPDCFNSGVFVYKPSIETFNKLLQFAVEKGSFDGGDQGLLNQFFSDWATEDIKKHLPFVYNLTSVAAYSYIPAFKQYGAETRIVHFIGTGKPWLHQLDPATKTVTPTSGSEHLAPLLQQWWDLFCEKVHPNLSKNLENNNDGMSHLPVEACSNTPVALTSDEPQPPRLIEPCLQYREKDDYRQHNLPYQPFDVRGSSGELLNVEFLLASVVPPESTEEQQGEDGNEMEEKDTKPEVQEKIKDTEQVTETKSEIADNKEEEKQEEPPTPRDPFDYNTFFPDEKCITNYLERNVLTYQPFEAPQEDPQPKNTKLPRFLTMPEDDQRQKGNIEIVEHRQAPELPLPPPPAPPVGQEKSLEVEIQPTPLPPVEKQDLPKSKSMTFIPSNVIATETPSLPVRSIWKSQPNVNIDRRYSMPKLKPLLPRQNSKSVQSPIPRVTLYTEFLMSADYKDPVDIPKDKVGFVETELKRSKSEADLKGKFGPLPYTKSPEMEIPEPKKSPLRELDNDAYDLTRCKRQLGNKPRDEKKENITSKLKIPSKDKISTLIKKRKSKELSPGDGGKEKSLKKERKERQSHKNNENLDRVLKRLREFSKNYQHYFGIDAQGGTKEKFTQSEFNQFRNFVKDQKETTQKGLLGIQDIMTEEINGTKVRNENINCKTPKIVSGLDKAEVKNIIVALNKEINTEREKITCVEDSKRLIQSSNRCDIRNERQSALPLDQEVLRNNADNDKLGTDVLIALENISDDQMNVKTTEGEASVNKHSRNIEHLKTTAKTEVVVLTKSSNNQNGCTSRTDNLTEHSMKSTEVQEAIPQNETTGENKFKMPNNECKSLANASGESPTRISENTEKYIKPEAEITKHSQSDLLFMSTTKQPENAIKDSLHSRPRASMKTQKIGTSKLLENIVENEKGAIMGTRTNGGYSKEKENEETEELDLGKVEQNSEPQLRADSVGNSTTLSINGKEKDEQPNKIISAVECQTPSEKLKVLHEETVRSDVLKLTKQETTAEINNTPQGSSKSSDEQKSIPLEIFSSQAPTEKSTPKGMFTIGSPERTAEAQEKSSTQSNRNVVSSPSVKQNLEVPQTSKVRGSTLKPDEILCVPDFETPRSSRFLSFNPHSDTDVTPQAPPSSPIATPRKARKQRKPYENGTKYRSSAGKKTVKTGNNKHCAGIAGAIAQLNLEEGGKAGDTETKSAAHEEYIRRQKWETGNMDYLGKDSFENIWSKICQTLEGKELDKATENTQSSLTISIEEKTKPKGAVGAETPASLCPEYIDALPSEPMTDPMEDDEIIFSKSEIRQKYLTNIKEEEENGCAAEGGSVKLSDILIPKEIVKPQTTTKGVGQTIVPAESNLGKELPGKGKPEEKFQAASIPIMPTPSEQAKEITKELPGKDKPEEKLQAASIAVTPTPSEQAREVKEQIKSGSGSESQTPIGGTAETQLDVKEAEIKPPRPSECTTVAICQPILIPGVPPEVQTGAKTLAQKIAEKKLQQQPSTPTEPIPLPAPDSPTRTECKTVAIPYPPIIAPSAEEKQPPVEQATEPVASSLLEVSVKHATKEEKQKKGVFSKLLEMVGVAPKTEEEVSKSVFYDVKEGISKAEDSEIIEPNINVLEINKESQSNVSEDKPKELEALPDSKPDTDGGVSEEAEVIKGADQIIAPEIKPESTISIPDSEEPALDVKPADEGGKKKPGPNSHKSGQAPMPKPARNASPRSSPQGAKNKSPSPLTIPQTTPETALTVATPPPPPEPPKRRNSALLKVEESIPLTPPVPEPTKESAEPMKSEIEDIIEKAKTEVESILQDEKRDNESDLINTMKLMIGAESQPKVEEMEELKVTSEEERQRHKGEVVSSKLSDQILKAIPPPRRKAISESKPEASGSSGAIPKTPTEEKPKQKPSSIPVPPPRNKGKPSTPAPPKGKTKK